jgi:hypothetical protein
MSFSFPLAQALTIFFLPCLSDFVGLLQAILLLFATDTLSYWHAVRYSASALLLGADHLVSLPACLVHFLSHHFFLLPYDLLMGLVPLDFIVHGVSFFPFIAQPQLIS